MPSSTVCRRGDVFLVSVRFSDGSGIKRRPAVVVSVDELHASRADTLIVPLTTNLSAH
ncbi:type II toxin-antitoxin system PemK/MazF family toxin [Tepidiforma sp.]|uniref:type II toxin-antitoxin system PemK/MazF family toxin n=1 Tax=Tepidiforma sp. TaxID=2682230 RepID=UPI002ADDA79B|nr:type II toxin-antitoxin system PemK/MazF family toxin [Tepidiforma sp.]